jgi:hypothetical protein
VRGVTVSMGALAEALLAAVVGVVGAVGVGACSSSSGPPSVHVSPESGIKDSTSPRDTAPDVIIDPENCVRPGTLSNTQGVGGYCSPGGGQCDMAGPGGSATLCSGDLGVTPAHAWFCTLSCGMTTDCGGGATCIDFATGSICVPSSCDSILGDGGLGDSGMSDAGDSSVDAPSEGATDAGPGDATSSDGAD